MLVGVRAVGSRHQPARAHQRGAAERLEVIARPGEKLVRDLATNQRRVLSGLTNERPALPVRDWPLGGTRSPRPGLVFST